MPDDGIREELRAINITLRELINCLSGKRFREPAPLEAQAIALLLRDGPNVTRIASELGVHTKTLYRMKKFRECLDRMRGTGRVRRGFRTTEGLEAVNDD